MVLPIVVGTVPFNPGSLRPSPPPGSFQVRVEPSEDPPSYQACQHVHGDFSETEEFADCERRDRSRSPHVMHGDTSFSPSYLFVRPPTYREAVKVTPGKTGN